MNCPDCGSPAVVFDVPAVYVEYVPAEQETVALCTRCLSLHPAEDAPAEPEFSRVSEGFPEGEAAVPLALLLGLLENLALYRSEITELLQAVERAGTDPLLALDRLARDPDIDAAADLSGRRRQLEQLL
jgi:hypothetical protein